MTQRLKGRPIDKFGVLLLAVIAPVQIYAE